MGQLWYTSYDLNFFKAYFYHLETGHLFMLPTWISHIRRREIYPGFKVSYKTYDNT